MFTGIVQEVGRVRTVRRRGAAAIVEIELGRLSGEVSKGDSVLVDGVCLTASDVLAETVAFDLAAETLGTTTLGQLGPGSAVNLELAMRPTDRFGGHFVSGHVDGTGTILEKTVRPGETRLVVQVPSALTDMMVPRGSVALDGISLTIAALRDGEFEVSLIPHTLGATTLGRKGAGAAVNIECDMIGKWVRRFLAGQAEVTGEGGGLTLEKLEEEGF